MVWGAFSKDYVKILKKCLPPLINQHPLVNNPRLAAMNIIFTDLQALEEAAKNIWKEILSSREARHKYAFR